MTHILFEALTLGDTADRDAVTALLERASGLDGADDGWVGAPASGSLHAGDLLWRTRFADEAAYRRWRRDPFWSGSDAARLDAGIAARDRIFYRSALGRSRARSVPGIWRGLVFAIRPAAPRREVTALEAALLAMPAHIPEIRAWRLSHAIEATGARAWSHMWEQEFDTVADLRGDYLTHPLHWGHVDGWFDPECPQWIVDTRTIHCFAETGDAIML